MVGSRQRTRQRSCDQQGQDRLRSNLPISRADQTRGAMCACARAHRPLPRGPEQRIHDRRHNACAASHGYTATRPAPRGETRTRIQPVHQRQPRQRRVCEALWHVLHACALTRAPHSGAARTITAIVNPATTSNRRLRRAYWRTHATPARHAPRTGGEQGAALLPRHVTCMMASQWSRRPSATRQPTRASEPQHSAIDAHSDSHPTRCARLLRQN